MSLVTMAGLLMDFLSTPEVIAALYTLILITIFKGVDDSMQSTNSPIISFTPIISSNKNSITKKILPRSQPQSSPKVQDENDSRKKLEDQKNSADFKKEDSGPSKAIEETTGHSNLYIERWKNLNLNHPPSFPFDRLAFLNSMHSHCNREHFIFLRNSQLKQLSKKEASERTMWCEDYHPKKLITDLFAIYVHRRSHFFRSRKVWAVDKRQFTLNYLMRQKLGRGPEICADNLVYGATGCYGEHDFCDGSSEESICTNSKELNGSKKSVKEGIKEKFNNVVASMKQRSRNFAAKNSDDVDGVDSLQDGQEN